MENEKHCHLPSVYETLTSKMLKIKNTKLKFYARYIGNKLMAPKGKGGRGNKSGVRHCLIHTTVFKAARGIVCNIL